MNIANVKTLIWLGAFSTAGYLAWDLSDYLRNRSQVEVPVSPEEQRAVLDGVQIEEAPTQDLIDYKVVESVFHTMNWTGLEAPEPVVKGPGGPPPPKPKKPVSDLIDVLMVRIDTYDQSGSRASVRYKNPTTGAGGGRGGKRRRSAGADNTDVVAIGDLLRDPSVRVKNIRVDGVVFEFPKDEDRKTELVETKKPEDPNRPQIVVVKPGGKAIVQKSGSLIPKVLERDRVIYSETHKIGPDEYRLGSRTIENIDQNYAAILSRDLRYRSARDPSTGRITGIEVTHVAPGSIPEAHGLQSGEVLKSINGQPVTSLNGAIAYVKKESATTDRWVVVIERQGREYTRTFHSPIE